ncbi:MAG: hypothetical protein OES79_04495, partial [Planctomycetota bacterium]|nr:hypothetical protein [Planctomycetota bacterium]
NEVLPNPALVAVERDALVEEWELPDTNAVLSYRQTQAKVDWSFPSHPQTPTTKGTQRLSLSYGQRDVQLRLDADLNTRGGFLFRHQIEVPAGLKVERVAVRGTAEQLLRRWTQDKQQLSVFLTGPVTGAHQLQVFGQMPRGGDVERAPTLQLQNVQWNESELAVYRRDAVLVKIDKTTNLASVVEPSDAALPGSFGRLVDVFRCTDTDATCRVVVQQNDPQVEAIQAIRMVRRRDEWLAALDLRMTVRSGKVDALTFDIPTAWEGPFEIEPVEPFEVQRSASGKTAAIIVRPSEAITNQYRLQIRGRLVQGVGNRVVTPDVRLRNAADVQRFVILPKLVGGREVEWEKTGMEPQDLPAAADQPPPANTLWESYRIAAPVHGAMLRIRGRRQQSAKVRLSNIYLAASPDGRHVGLAQFDVDPAGERQFWLQMPGDQFQLAQGRIGDSVLPMTFDKSGKWRLPIVSQSLPQRIEILFVAQNARRVGRQQFKAPRLLGPRGPLPVERTMWTIIGGPELTADFGENDKAKPVTAWDLEVFRFERTVDMLNDVVTDDPADVLVHWYQRWCTRLDETYRQIEGQAAVATGQEVKLRQIDRQRAHFRRLARQGTSAAVGESIQQSRFFADQVLSNLSSPGARVRRLAFDGWQGEVVIALSGRGSGLLLRLLAAAGVVGLCVVAGWLTVGGRRMLAERELLATAVFVAGLVGWLWISPSILGLAFIAVAAVLMWPGDWKRVAG